MTTPCSDPSRPPPTWVLTLIKGERLDDAAPMLLSLERRAHPAGSPGAPALHALRGMLEAARGNRGAAMRELVAAAPFLRGGPSGIADELSTRTHDERRRACIIEAYMDLLADVRGTSIERDAGVDAVAEAFRLADVVRSRLAQRALDAGGARSAASTPALAEIVRRNQDAKREIDARYRRLASLLARPGADAGEDAMAALDGEIEALRRTRQEPGSSRRASPPTASS